MLECLGVELPLGVVGLAAEFGPKVCSGLWLRPEGNMCHSKKKNQCKQLRLECTKPWLFFFLMVTQRQEDKIVFSQAKESLLVASVK